MIPTKILSGPTKEKRPFGNLGKKRLLLVYETDAGTMSVMEIAALRNTKGNNIWSKIKAADGFPVLLDIDCRGLGTKRYGSEERTARALKILSQPIGTWERTQLRGE